MSAEVTSSMENTSLEEGSHLLSSQVTFKRIDLMRYCGACNDFTGTHWNERIAKLVGLPNVISHGTLNIASAVRVISDHLGSKYEFVEYSVHNFSNPVVVPDDDEGGSFVVSAKVESIVDDIVTFRIYSSRPDAMKVMTGARAIFRYIGDKRDEFLDLSVHTLRTPKL